MPGEVWAEGGGRAWAGGSARAACTARGSGCECWGARACAERTANMRYMSVTLDVSKLSGWLNASAYCRVERRGVRCGARCGPVRRLVKTTGRRGTQPRTAGGYEVAQREPRRARVSRFRDFIFRLQCRKADVVFPGELPNHPASVLCESATTTWRRSHHEETQPTEHGSVNDAIILSSTPRDRACSSTSRSSSERPGQPHFWWQIVRLHSVTAEGASCAARAFPSEGMQTTRTARCVPADRFPDGVPGTGREPSASLMTNASSAAA